MTRLEFDKWLGSLDLRFWGTSPYVIRSECSSAACPTGGCASA
jgi:hypothetical protein